MRFRIIIICFVAAVLLGWYKLADSLPCYVVLSIFLYLFLLLLSMFTIFHEGRALGRVVLVVVIFSFISLVVGESVLSWIIWSLYDFAA